MSSSSAEQLDAKQKAKQLVASPTVTQKEPQSYFMWQKATPERSSVDCIFGTTTVLKCHRCALVFDAAKKEFHQAAYIAIGDITCDIYVFCGRECYMSCIDSRDGTKYLTVSARAPPPGESARLFYPSHWCVVAPSSTSASATK